MRWTPAATSAADAAASDGAPACSVLLTVPVCSGAAAAALPSPPPPGCAAVSSWAMYAAAVLRPAPQQSAQEAADTMADGRARTCCEIRPNDRRNDCCRAVYRCNSARCDSMCSCTARRGRRSPKTCMFCHLNEIRCPWRRARKLLICSCTSLDV